MEKMFERCFYSARWLIAPVFLGLSLALVALALKFFQEVVHVLPHVFELSESDLILSLLSMIDMGLVGGLIVMVMYSSYENFVSRLDIEKEGSDKLSWLGKMDSGSLKNKVAASIVAISSIHLLLIQTAEAEKKRRRMWQRIRVHDKGLYYRLRYSTLSGLTYLPGKLGGKITVGGYRFARKIYQFQ